ncbi:hypothetical protein JCM16358_01040 [Halanaerocella petrolearia]
MCYEGSFYYVKSCKQEEDRDAHHVELEHKAADKSQQKKRKLKK